MSFFYKPYNLKKIQLSLQNNDEQARAHLKIYSVTMSTWKEFCKKRAFCSASLPGLMTVEAAIVLPLFLMAFLSLLNFIHMTGTNAAIFTALANTVHPAGIYAYNEDYGEDSLYPRMVYQLGTADIDFKQITGGMAGLNYQGTEYNKDTGEITLTVSYGLKPLFSLFRQTNVRAANTVYSRGYIGGKLLADSGDSSDQQTITVYVAENGVVYHKDRSCAYIDISFHAVNSSGINDLRNTGGAKYYPCELCLAHGGGGSGVGSSNGSSTGSGTGSGGSGSGAGVVYITDTGNRYHATSGCSGLKRTVYTMEITGECALPACSRCGR